MKYEELCGAQGTGEGNGKCLYKGVWWYKYLRLEAAQDAGQGGYNPDCRPKSGQASYLHFTTDYILYNWVCDE